MDKIFNRYTDFLIDNSIVKEDEKELYVYGMRLMFSGMVDILIILVASIFLHRFIETFLYLLVFLPLRVYAGGYHADSELRCLMIFIATYILFLLCITFITPAAFCIITIASIILCVLFAVWFAPIEHHNRPLNNIEMKVYKKICIGISVIESVVILLFMIISPSNVYMFAMALGELSTTLSMLAAIIKKSIKGRRIILYLSRYKIHINHFE